MQRREVALFLIKSKVSSSDPKLASTAEPQCCVMLLPDSKLGANILQKVVSQPTVPKLSCSLATVRRVSRVVVLKKY